MVNKLVDRPKRIVVLGESRSLVNFRGPLIRALLSQGYHVTVIAGTDDPEVRRTLVGWGAVYETIPLARAGLNPIADLITVLRLTAFFRRTRPDVFFGYTIKPVIYGLIAAFLAGTPRRYVMITGLGYAFTEGGETKRYVVRAISSCVYRASLRLADRVIFQNVDDQRLFLTRRLVNAGQVVCVPGSGVDLEYYTPTPFPKGPITFLLIARLLADKGIREYAKAASIVRVGFPYARFVLLGAPDTNPSGLRLDEVHRWVKEGLLEYKSETRDVRSAISHCHVFVLPSYREGMPRTVLEAMAMGRPIITTDVPGCRETVAPGLNGFLVTPRNAEALARAMMMFLRDEGLCRKMGAHSSEIAAHKFESKQIAIATISAMGLLPPTVQDETPNLEAAR